MGRGTCLGRIGVPKVVALPFTFVLCGLFSMYSDMVPLGNRADIGDISPCKAKR